MIGLEGQEQQWRYCVSDTHNAMGFAIGAMFVREVFHGKSKPMVNLHSLIYFSIMIITIIVIIIIIIMI